MNLLGSLIGGAVSLFAALNIESQSLPSDYSRRYNLEYLPISFCGIFEVHVTSYLLGIWDHNIGND